MLGFSGHRYNEGLGLIEECRRRGWDLELLISTHADAEVRRALGDRARPVLDDPTFDFARTFEARVDGFVAQFHAHVDPLLESDSRVLVTVATQCEACALARWAKTLPPERVPWVSILFLSDRWNREGARPEEPAEIETAAREFATLTPATRNRFVLCASTQLLATELMLRLRQPVSPAPAHLNYQGLEAIARVRLERTRSQPPAIALLGGSRSEKGSDRTVDIVATTRSRVNVRFIVQAYNEGLDAAQFERLRSLGGAPDVTLIEGPLDRSQYERLLADADALLCPYERRNYRQRNSGILSEAIAAGLPGIVPSRTWLAEQIESGRGAGVVYDGYGAEVEADAIARFVTNLGALTASAATLATPWREQQSLASFLDAIEALRAERDLTG